MENNNLEQLYAIRFCVKVGEVATDTYKEIQRALGMILYHVLKYFGHTKTL
jgi:hypothetical protein